MPSSTPKERLAKRTIQLLGFGTAFILLTVTIFASLTGKDAGVSEMFIAGMIGVGVSAEIDFANWFKK